MKIIKRHKKYCTKKRAASTPADDFSIFSDEQLWQQFTSGSRPAFEQIYYRYINRLYDYGVRLSRDKLLAEDCVQDFFTHLWEHQHKLPEVKAVKAYLLVSLKRRIYRKLSEQKKDIIKIHEILDPEAYGFEPETADESESSLGLRQAFGKLSDRQKEVIYLRFYNQLTYQEIAEVMDVQVKAVYKLMGRAIQSLKENIVKPNLAHLLLAILAS